MALSIAFIFGCLPIFLSREFAIVALAIQLQFASLQMAKE
jgi:hypothetical protein